jgi:dihydroxyacetone kinase-like protein
MQKLRNAADAFVDEMLDGLVTAHPTLLREARVVRAAHAPKRGKVGIVSGGGSGHLPLFTGYVGPGLLDACAIGDVFAGPSVDSGVQAITAAEGGRGVLRLYGNYGGDRMNFDLAGEMVEMDDISTTTVLGTDDIASAPPQEAAKRRGVAGIIYAYKIAGAMADRGADLFEVTAVAQASVDACRTIGVALSPCQIPGASQPSFAIGDDEIEMGMGIHGEPGIWRDKMKPVDAIVDEMVARLLADPVPTRTSRVSVLVNSLGATPLEELFIAYRRVASILVKEGFEIVRPLVGPYVTSMEMAGMSISLIHLDSEREGLLTASANCPFWSVA